MVQRDMWEDENEKKVPVKKAEISDIPFSASLLKSAIQKAVRRCDVKRAVICAKALMEKNMMEFLRRWGIIVIEDALLHPMYGEAMRMAMRKVTNVEQLEESEKDMLLNMVADVAAMRVRDDFYKINTDVGKVQFEDMNYEGMGEKEVGLVKALKYRAAIGGMAGDIDMMRKMAAVWHWRFREGGWTVEKLWGYFDFGNDWKWKDVPVVEKTDIMLEAVDFHCFPKMLTLLAEKNYVKGMMAQNFPKADIEKQLLLIIWRMRSGVQYKKQIGYGREVDWFKDTENDVEHEREAHEFVWDRISGEVNKISIWWLGKCAEKKGKNG